MLEKSQKTIDFFAQYPAWVIVSSILLVTLAIILLIVFRPEQPRQAEADKSVPESESPGSPVTPSSSSPKSTHDSIAVLTAYNRDVGSSIPSDAQLIRRVWHGSVSQIEQATRADLIEATKRHSALHIEAEVRNDSILFDDGPMAASQLSDILSLDLSKTELVVLSACSSFRIGKALEESKIRHSLVALGNLRVDIASAFYHEFYSQWSTGAPVETAYDRAAVSTSARYNLDVKELIMVTTYRGGDQP